MVNKEEIINITNTILKEENSLFSDSQLFLVDVKVSSDNRITIFLDSLEGVKISDCAILSRKIEEKLDREHEDFDLIVSSAGLDQGLIVVEQYKKNIGKHLKILSSDGERYKAELIKVSETGIVVKLENKKSKKKSSPGIEEIIKFDFDQIKEAKVIITF